MNTKQIADWYDQKYTEMGGGWKCGVEEANRLLEWAGFEKGHELLLDIGCGDGDFILTASEYATCFGIDLSHVIIEMAKNNLLQSGKTVDFRVESIEETDFKDEQFAYLTSIGSIEHVEDIDKALKECYRILKKDGKFLCLVPNELWKYNDQPQEQTHTDEEWQALFEKAAFKVVKKNRRNDLTDFLLMKKC